MNFLTVLGVRMLKCSCWSPEVPAFFICWPQNFPCCDVLLGLCWPYILFYGLFSCLPLLLSYRIQDGLYSRINLFPHDLKLKDFWNLRETFLKHITGHNMNKVQWMRREDGYTRWLEALKIYLLLYLLYTYLLTLYYSFLLMYCYH